ncbi:MAG: hypothetical protein KO316_09200 [Methanobacterium sp.]|jgi:hypothetical protein|nr:hypothetical protein [Methanobacterium sp.]
MGYLICEKCGGYYELQSGESPDDFSDECECGGKLIYSETLEVLGETDRIEGTEDVEGKKKVEDTGDVKGSVEVEYPEEVEETEKIEDAEETQIIQQESSENQEATPSYEYEPPIKKRGESIEEYKATFEARSQLNDLKRASDVQEILDVKGSYLIKGKGAGDSLKVIDEGIETGDGQFIRFEDIISIKAEENETSRKSGFKSLFSRDILIAASKRDLIIKSSEGEIELKDVWKKDAEKLVSFVNRRLIKIN